ncbi:hypothetical protein NSMM_470049 [Nitrosomonas mobilis]|uniref:Transposase n=1 Tax=Nitrosomonas mobilis TaxID=51642 RepID=A0A1G5SGI5_9PROT|nr:hypothetical protein NSMM_470049 [Nitrosomonas mobilis]
MIIRCNVVTLLTNQFSDSLTELLRRGAKQLLEQAVEAELTGFMEQFSGRKLNDGRAAVVRNGYRPERNIQTSIGPVTVKIPKVRAKDGDPVTFRSALLWCRAVCTEDSFAGGGVTLAVFEGCFRLSMKQ